MARRSAILLLAGVLSLVPVACGSSNGAPPGLTISGPGLQTGQPPWPAEYRHLAERLRRLGLPPGGKETFHTHALLHIYVAGQLVPIAANVGLDPSHGVESSLHTHDHSGVIHMEAPRPYNYTLGDFFAVWGVKLGPGQLGGLTGYGGDKLHFYLDGRSLSNPAAHVLHNNDSIVIGYGSLSSFPHAPSTFPLKEVEGKGGGALSCGIAPAGKKTTPCLVTPPTPAPSSTAPSSKKKA